MSEERDFDTTKQAVLTHIQTVFEEMEAEMALSHQEKYAMLEDVFEQATDHDELRVAFEQWYAEHADDVEFGIEMHELWDQALAHLDESEDGEW